MLIKFSEEQTMIRDMVREFTKKEVEFYDQCRAQWTGRHRDQYGDHDSGKNQNASGTDDSHDHDTGSFHHGIQS